MNPEKILKKYGVDIVLYSGNNQSKRSHIVLARKVIVRIEKRKYLYGGEVTIYHEMAYNPQGDLIPRKKKIHKNNRNWLASFCIKALHVHYEEGDFLPSLTEALSGRIPKNVPFYDETSLIIEDQPIVNPIEENPIIEHNVDSVEDHKSNEIIPHVKYVIPAKRRNLSINSTRKSKKYRGRKRSRNNIKEKQSKWK